MLTCSKDTITPFHVHRSRKKRCDCGEKSNPMYRTFWQRFMDKRNYRRLQKELGR